jgi:hypothetical protein
VIYERRADAIQAVDVYHNRKLDGRPMKCDMVRNVGSNTTGSISLAWINNRNIKLINIYIKLLTSIIYDFITFIITIYNYNYIF